MNLRFTSIKKKMEDRVYSMKEHVTNQISMIKHRYDDVAIEIGGYNVSDEYDGFGFVDDDGDIHVCDDYDDFPLPKIAIENSMSRQPK